MLPRLRETFHSSAPNALVPMQHRTIVPTSGLQGEDRRPLERTIKRSRLMRGVAFPTAVVDMERTQSGSMGGGEHDNDSTGASGSDNGGYHVAGSGSGRGSGADRVMRSTHSGTPLHGEHGSGVGGGYDRDSEGFERNNGAGAGPRLTRNAEESQNDWEVVVDMYQTGRGTADGVALKMITKGDGRKVSDRKLLEKRRTIGKTYELLGAERFEAAIGYKWENGVRRKQKMYHVISRCRVVNAMRRSDEPIPDDHDRLTELIDEKIAEKEAQKEAGRSGTAAVSGRDGGMLTSENRVNEAGVGSYRMDALGRMVVSGGGRKLSADGDERNMDGTSRGARSVRRLSGDGERGEMDEITAVVRQDRRRFR